MSVDEMVVKVKELGPAARHVVVTGGEPMIMPEIVALCGELKSAGYHITIETAATVFKDLAVDLASLSPKLSNSTPWEREGGKFAAAHEKQRINVEVIQKFIDTSPDFQLKFVVSEWKDLAEIDELLKQLRGWKNEDVQLMAEGTDARTLEERALWLADVCKERGWRLTPRLHVMIWGNRRGT